MTKFKFRLESALRLRRLRVEAERAKLQELTGQRDRLERSRVALQEQRADASTFVQNAQGAGWGDLRSLSSFTIGLEVHAKTIREAVARAEAQVEVQRKRLRLAEQEELCLSKLRDTRYAEWNLQFEREIEATAQELWLCGHTTKLEDSEPG